jgi:peptidyl-prolyl cis-trans isomerase A (cyclophilin A)
MQGGFAMHLVRLTLLLAAAVIVCPGCSKKSAESPAANGESATAASSQVAANAVVTPTSATRVVAPRAKPVDPMVVLHTTLGDITLQLFAEKAPRTVENFLSNYAQRGFYDQTIFHHHEPGLMLIAGGYTAELERKPTRSPIYNESRNGISNRRGTIAMIRDPESPHSATSEFFFNLTDNENFDFKQADNEDLPGYCVFGEVKQGMDVVDRIAQLSTVAKGEFSKVPSPEVSIVSVQRLQ